jgi:deoxyribonuclease (pyrimidine dimer)
MTRINLVPPIILCDQHLVAEYREIVRIPTLFWNAYYSERTITVPDKFTLGTGHVKFFYDKQKYIENRFADLVSEMEARSMMPAMQWRSEQVPTDYYLDYEPTNDDYVLICERLIEATYRMKVIPKYNGILLMREAVVDMINAWLKEKIASDIQKETVKQFYSLY